LRNLGGGQFAVWQHRLHRFVDDTLALPEAPGSLFQFRYEPGAV
jgi:hypothetical protein